MVAGGERVRCGVGRRLEEGQDGFPVSALRGAMGCL